MPATFGLGFLPGMGAPTLLAPLPLLTTMPALLLSEFGGGYAALLLPSVLFLAWNPQFFRAAGKIPKRSYVLLAILTILSAVYLAASWKLGVKYEGPQYTAIICSVNLVWMGFLGLAFGRTLHSSSSFRTSLFLHWMLFAWLGWYAFPWLGELI